VAAITTAAAFPFTWFLTRMRSRWQVSLLVMILAALTLSEVIVAFSWNLILGRASGITTSSSGPGLMDEPRALTPGLAAVVAGLAYIAFPYCVITLFPSLKRIDRELTDAAGTLGASPARTFRTVVVPLARTSVVAAFLLVFVFTLGSYIIAQVLGRPEHWTCRCSSPTRPCSTPRPVRSRHGDAAHRHQRRRGRWRLAHRRPARPKGDLTCECSGASSSCSSCCS
jgi:putative spermidine/putrescine transport system permease protein